MNEEVKAINRTGVILLLAMVCCFLWGSATPSIKTGYEMFAIQGDDTWSIILFAGVRFFLAGLLVILFESLHQKRFVLPEAGSAPYIVKLALAQTIIQYFFFYIGLAHTSGVTGTILSGSGGFISIILVCIVLRSERLSANKIVGVILGFSGIIIMNISFNGDTSAHFTLLGEGFVLLSQISYAMRHSSRLSHTRCGALCSNTTRSAGWPSSTSSLRCGVRSSRQSSLEKSNRPCRSTRWSPSCWFHWGST